MKDGVDQILLVGLISIALFGIGLATNTVQPFDFVLVVGFLALSGVGYKVLQGDLLQKQVSRLNSGKNNGGKENYTYAEGKQILKDFAVREFSGRINSKKGISIDQSRSSSQPTDIWPTPDPDDVFLVRHYYVTHGDLNKPMDFFVDVTNGRYFAHDQVWKRRSGSKSRNPFEKLDMYETSKYNRRKAAVSSDNSVDASQLRGIPMGFPQGGRGDEEG